MKAKIKKMAVIKNLAGLSNEEINQELNNGAKYVIIEKHN